MANMGLNAFSVEFWPLAGNVLCYGFILFHMIWFIERWMGGGGGGGGGLDQPATLYLITFTINPIAPFPF